LIKDEEKLILAVREKDFVHLDETTRALLARENLGFLIITDTEGEVLVRAHAPSKKEDTLRGEEAVKQATMESAIAQGQPPAPGAPTSAGLPCRPSVAEVPAAGEDHGHAVFVGGGDDFIT